eukprot:195381_1
MEPASPTNLCDLFDDLWVKVLQYLKFEEIISSVWMVSKRFYALRSNCHSLYSIKNYPFTDCAAASLMKRYCLSLVKTNAIHAFIFRKIKKVEWMHRLEPRDNPNTNYAMGAALQNLTTLLQMPPNPPNVPHFMQTLNRIPLDAASLEEADAVFFSNLCALQYLSTYGLPKTFMEHLPIQKHLESLCIHSVHNPSTTLTFLRSKIHVDSLCLLKELSIERLTISVDMLSILSKMIHLEVLRFPEVHFEIANTAINKKLLKDTFSCWTDVHTLDIFDISMDREERLDPNCSFLNGALYDTLLEILLSFESLSSLKIGIEPFGDLAYTEDSSINRVLPFFEAINGLKELHLLATTKNMFLNQQIIKTIQNSQTEKRFEHMNIEFPLMMDYSEDVDYAGFIVESMAVTSNIFKVRLPHGYVNGTYDSSRGPFHAFVECLDNQRQNIDVKELHMELCYMTDLSDVSEMNILARIAGILSKVCREIGCTVKIQWEHGGGRYSQQEQDLIEDHIINIMSDAGFVVYWTHADLALDCLLLHLK